MSMLGHYRRVTQDQLDSLLRFPDRVEDFLYSEEDDEQSALLQKGDALDIDKAWHGIHFLLTGDAWGGDPPLANAVLGGTEIGEDLGYGPARYLQPQEVREVADALSAISPDELKRRYDPKALTAADIYPSGWRADDADYLASYYGELVRFFKEAAAAGDVMLLYIT